MKYIKLYETYKQYYTTEEPPFKVGEIVMCIETSYGNFEITKGETYTIKHIYKGQSLYLCEVDNDSFGFYCRKFRKLTKKELDDVLLKMNIEKYNL